VVTQQKFARNAIGVDGSDVFNDEVLAATTFDTPLQPSAVTPSERRHVRTVVTCGTSCNLFQQHLSHVAHNLMTWELNLPNLVTCLVIVLPMGLLWAYTTSSSFKPLGSPGQLTGLVPHDPFGLIALFNRRSKLRGRFSRVSNEQLGIKVLYPPTEREQNSAKVEYDYIFKPRRAPILTDRESILLVLWPFMDLPPFRTARGLLIQMKVWLEEIMTMLELAE